MDSTDVDDVVEWGEKARGNGGLFMSLWRLWEHRHAGRKTDYYTRWLGHSVLLRFAKV